MRKLFISISTLLFAACAPKFPALTPDEFEQKIAEPDVQLVDVRTPEEYCQGYIVRAMNIDWKSAEFEEDARRILKPDKPIAIYCKALRMYRVTTYRVPRCCATDNFISCAATRPIRYKDN